MHATATASTTHPSATTAAGPCAFTPVDPAAADRVLTRMIERTRYWLSRWEEKLQRDAAGTSSH